LQHEILSSTLKKKPSKNVPLLLKYMETFNVLSHLKHNWKSGLTVALVSIPLSISLAVASQATPIAGIITAVWAGLVASIFGGSNFNIIGPTGALSGFLATYAITHGACNLPMLAIVTGLFILIAYKLKLERYIAYVPMSVVHGFTLGVALIIILNQLNFALGITNIPLHEKFIQNVYESCAHVSHFSGDTVLIFTLFLAALFIFLRLNLPSIIIAAPFGILVGYLAHHGTIPLHLATLATKFGEIKSQLIQPLTLCFDTSLVLTGIAVASVAILETLISANIADHMTKTRYNERKEMLGLGLANCVAGLCGGIPATAALARTALNVRSGATHKIAQGISSVAIAGISLLFLRYFSYLPLAVIAANLVFIAVRMIEHEHFVHLWHNERKNFWLALLVASICIFEDPIAGIFLGTAFSLLMQRYQR